MLPETRELWLIQYPDIYIFHLIPHEDGAIPKPIVTPGISSCMTSFSAPHLFSESFHIVALGCPLLLIIKCMS